MLKEVFKDFVSVEDIRQCDSVDIKIYKGLPLEELQKGELNKLFNSQKHQLTKGDRIFIMSGCNIPRFKLSSLKESLGIAISKTAANASIIIYSDDTLKEYINDEYFSQYCNKQLLIDYINNGNFNNADEIKNILAAENTMDFVSVPHWGDWRLLSLKYPSSKRMWKANPDMLDELEEILTDGKILMHQNDLLALLNTSVHMTEDMYREARKMFESTDANNHVLAMELMANCDYDKSCVFLLKLLSDFSSEIGNRREKNHVNFKALCKYFGHKMGYRLDIDGCIEILKKKKLLTNDRLDTLMKVSMEEFQEDLSRTTNYFDVKLIVPNQELIKAIDDVEKVLSGEASESILEDKQEDNNWDDDDDDN